MRAGERNAGGIRMMPGKLLGDSCERGENFNHGDLSEAREGSDIEGPAAARIECLKSRHTYVSSAGVSVKFLRSIFLGLVFYRYPKDHVGA